MDLCNDSSLAAELVWRGHRQDSYLMTVHQPSHCLHPQFFCELRVCWQCMTVRCGPGMRQLNAPVVLSTIPYLALRIPQEEPLVRFMRGFR
jgi:hypothetical protein